MNMNIDLICNLFDNKIVFEAFFSMLPLSSNN
jgi:hypothetical protein